MLTVSYVKTRASSELEQYPLTLSPREFATALGVGRDSIYAAIRAGKLVTIKTGRAFRIPRTEIDRIMREGLWLD